MRSLEGFNSLLSSLFIDSNDDAGVVHNVVDFDLLWDSLWHFRHAWDIWLSHFDFMVLWLRVTVVEGLRHAWLVLTLDLNWVVSRLSDLQEAMETVGTNVALAFFAQVIVLKMSCLVPDSSDRTRVTAVADDPLVNHFHLVLSFLLKMVLEKSLVLLSAEVLDFNLKHLVKFFEEPVVELTSGVASSAWKTLFVDFLSITSEAFWQILIISINGV